MKKRKFARGEPIKSYAYAVYVIGAGRYVFFWNKPMHPAWMSSMTLRTIIGLVQRGALFEAIRNKE